MSQKTARKQRAAGRAQPPPRRPTTQGTLSGIPRSWLYGGLAAVVIAVVLVLVLASQLGGEEAEAPTAIDGTEATAMLDGIPQDGTSLGSPDAPVVLYEFADLQCPYCQQWDRNVLPVLIQDYVRSGQLRIVFQGLAFIGPDSEKALRSALAAGEQDRLWHVVDLLYRHQGGENDGWVTDELVAGIGAAVPGLDGEQMVEDGDSDAVASGMSSAAAQADSFGINSTPSFLVGANGGELDVLDVGSLEPEPYVEAIDRLLGQ
jgi:protein-disulfide isomerase